MAKPREIQYDDIYIKIHPEQFSEEAFEILNRGDFWEDFTDASWMSLESPTVKTAFDLLKNAIVLYSKQIEFEKSQVQQKEIQTIHSKLIKEIELFRIDHRKKVRKSNILFFISFTVFAPLIYILVLAIYSRSLSPSLWYKEFLYHLNVAGIWVKSIFYGLIVIGALFFTGGVMSFLEKSFPEKIKTIPKGLLTYAMFASMAILILVICKGITATFGINILPAMD